MYVCTVSNALPLHLPTFGWQCLEELTSGIFLRATAAAFTKKSLTEILYSPPDTSFIALRTLDGVEDTQTHGLTYVHLINCHLICCFTNICGGRTHAVSRYTHTGTESASFTDGKCGHTDIHLVHQCVCVCVCVVIKGLCRGLPT